MLSAEQIKNNWDKFLSYINTFISGERKEKLTNFYLKHEDRIIMMPASNKPQYHNCFPGGYIDHVNRVIECALKINNIWVDMGVDDTTYTLEELIFSAINHDLGKFGSEEHEAYIEQTDQWRKDKLNEQYTFNDRLEYMTIPDRGLYILMSNGIEFNKNEMMAIKLHDGIYDESNKPYLLGWSPETKPRTSLYFILHQADFMASRIEFEGEWLPKFNSSVKTKKVKLEKTTIKTKALGNIKSEKLKNLLDNI
jgi:hypothetical protein